MDTAAEILVVTGDNLERIKSEAALAKLAGIAPVPTGSGMTSYGVDDRPVQNRSHQTKAALEDALARRVTTAECVD
ncbi:transposase [Streptomyces sp. NPDC057582]|uniref:transposase n=1 Tax=Streptomyces sp. NPDC057582 TaxID=3346174 RepID=UPI0036BC3C9A